MRIALVDRNSGTTTSDDELRLMDRAFEALRESNPELGQMAEFRVFGGLSAEAAARVVGLSPGAAKRQWSQAKAFLMRFLEEDPQRQEPVSAY